MSSHGYLRCTRLVVVAHLLYDWGGHRLSLFVMPPLPTRSEGTERVIDGVELYTATLYGTTITWWEDAERLYVAASGPSNLLMGKRI